MDKLLNDQILVRSEKWFTDIISGNHQRALEKCKNPDIYNINPFLIRYLAAFIDGQVTSESFAKALIYPQNILSFGGIGRPPRANGIAPQKAV